MHLFLDVVNMFKIFGIFVFHLLGMNDSYSVDAVVGIHLLGKMEEP
jgi:hypothetical protein